jgi:phenylacetic acid degradation operon negative regulatory protein
LAVLREGVWMRPANVAVLLPDSLDADVELMHARPDDAAVLASRLWDLTKWARHADELLDELRALVPDGPEALAPGFVLSAAVLRHLQADPLLPAELQPPGWPGGRLREIYDDWDTRYRATLRIWSRRG